MKTPQKLVVTVIGIAALLLMLYPPFYIRGANGVATNLGYHFLLDPPRRGEIVALIHVPTLLVQFVGLLLVGGAASIVAGSVQFTLKRVGVGPGPKFNPAVAAAIIEHQRASDADSPGASPPPR